MERGEGDKKKRTSHTYSIACEEKGRESKKQTNKKEKTRKKRGKKLTFFRCGEGERSSTVLYFSDHAPFPVFMCVGVFVLERTCLHVFTEKKRTRERGGTELETDR